MFQTSCSRCGSATAGYLGSRSFLAQSPVELASQPVGQTGAARRTPYICIASQQPLAFLSRIIIICIHGDRSTEPPSAVRGGFFAGRRDGSRSGDSFAASRGTVSPVARSHDRTRRSVLPATAHAQQQADPDEVAREGLRRGGMREQAYRRGRRQLSSSQKSCPTTAGRLARHRLPTPSCPTKSCLVLTKGSGEAFGEEACASKPIGEETTLSSSPKPAATETTSSSSQNLARRP